MSFLFTTERRDEIHPLLGYTANQLRDHFLAHPGCKGLTREDATIDHIFPQQAFRDYDISDAKIIHSLANLQPMSKAANSGKGATYNPSAFEAWLTKQGVAFTRPQRQRKGKSKAKQPRPRFKLPEPDFD